MDYGWNDELNLSHNQKYNLSIISGELEKVSLAFWSLVVCWCALLNLLEAVNRQLLHNIAL